MKAELVIEMEEECVDCPFLRLQTQMFEDDKVMSHKCIHIDNCRILRKHWENHLRKHMRKILEQQCENCDREEPAPFGRSNY